MNGFFAIFLRWLCQCCNVVNGKINYKKMSEIKFISKFNAANRTNSNKLLKFTKRNDLNGTNSAINYTIKITHNSPATISASIDNRCSRCSIAQTIDSSNFHLTISLSGTPRLHCDRVTHATDLSFPQFARKSERCCCREFLCPQTTHGSA